MRHVFAVVIAAAALLGIAGPASADSPADTTPQPGVVTPSDMPSWI
ncbi:hypothetical protein MOQ72_36295 [Saccharopolyspora sp. K220]|nr:hypothetical protein [Saccharopolyspora soli]MCI2422900.1 hypothetical protein [Saccharopolyspora soli]